MYLNKSLNSQAGCMACVFILLVLLCYSISGCQENYPLPPTNEVWTPHRFKISKPVLPSQEVATSWLHAYMFSEDHVLIKMYKSIPIESDGTITLPATERATIYLTSDLPEITGLENLQENHSSLTDFLLLNTPQLAGNTEPTLFYTGKTVINSSIPGNVLLQRNVAQIDLQIKNNADIKVTKVILENVPLQTTISGNDELTNPPYLPTGTRTLEFSDAGAGNTENICQIYETHPGVAIKATIHALYSGTKRIVHTTFPQIKRNYKYTLTIKDIGTTANGTIEVEPWTNGDTVNATDDILIYLNPNKTNGVVSGNTMTMTGFYNMVRISFSAPFAITNVTSGEEDTNYISRIDFIQTVTEDDRKTKTSSYNVYIHPDYGVSIPIIAKNADATVSRTFYIKVVPKTPLSVR